MAKKKQPLFKYVIDFQGLIDSGNIEVIQPDACKWDGVTGCVAVTGKALSSVCIVSIFLGGIGLIASAHILAAVGGAACWRWISTQTRFGRVLLKLWLLQKAQLSCCLTVRFFFNPISQFRLAFS